MSSNRNRQQREDAADSAPLLQQQQQDQDGDRDGPDTRFAIDEETIFDFDQEHDFSSTSRSQSSPSSASTIHNKYPPLPPTYQDAIRPNTFLSRHPELNEHLRHFQSRSREFLKSIPTPFSIWSRARSSCYRIGCWPENRMVQVGIFLFFLWILVIVAGPSFDVNDGKGGRQPPPGKSIWGDDLSATPPPPVSGDGHIVSPAKWEFHSCRSRRRSSSLSKKSSFPSSTSTSAFNLNLLKRLWGPPRRVTCISKTSFDLRVPASFEGTESVFFYADPERVHAKDRGRIGGNVHIVIDETLPKEEKPQVNTRDLYPYPGRRDENDYETSHDEERKEALERRSHHGHSHTKIKIDIDAKYDKDAQFLLDSSTVAKMGANLWDEGVGIYTWPLPPPFSFRAEDDPPLSFDVTIRIPPGAAVPALKTEVASMQVNAFTKTYSQVSSRSNEDDSSHDRALSNKPITSISRADTAMEVPHFGRFRVLTQTSSIATSSIRSISHIKLASSNGDVMILEKSALWGPAIRLSSLNGHIILQDQVSLQARNEVELKVRNGDVLSGDGTRIEGSKILVDCKNGRLGSVYPKKSIQEDSFAIFKANFSLNLHTNNGNLKAKVEVQEPDRRLIYNSGPEHRFWVNVDVSSDNGDIDLFYSKHENGVSLKSNLVAKAAGTVSIRHVDGFEGDWAIDGWKGSRVEGPERIDQEVEGKKRKFIILENGEKDGNGAGEKVIRGNIGWDPSSVKVGKEQDGFLPNGGISKATSNGGVVTMKFD